MAEPDTNYISQGTAFHKEISQLGRMKMVEPVDSQLT